MRHQHSFLSTRFRIVCAALIMFGIIGWGVGRIVAWPWSNQAQGPNLDCPERINLGEQERGDHLSAVITIRNSGDEELIIDGVKSPCGCTGLEQKTEGGSVRLNRYVIGAQQHGEFIVKLSVTGASGSPMKVPITFSTNDPLRQTVSIQLFVSNVRDGVYTTPSSVVFESVPLGTSVVRTLEVYDGSKFTAATESRPE